MIWREFDMERDMMLQLVIGYLEFSYDEFYEYLERHKEIEGSEAELIISDLEKIGNEKK